MKIISLLISLFIVDTCFCQRDTICTRRLDTIPCLIFKGGTQYIEFRDKKGREKTMDIHQVKWYVHKGTRVIPSRNARLAGPMRIDTIYADDEIRHMRFCLQKFHGQYTTGLGLTLFGGVAAASSVLLTDDNPLKNGMGFVGLLVMATGAVINIDAHKWLGRAGWGVNGKGNAVEVYYQFR